MDVETTENQSVQSNEQTGQDVDALYNSVMEPTAEPPEPVEGNQESNSEESNTESVKTDQGTTNDDMFTLKHKDFENGERQFSRDKVLEYAQKGFDYELKMHNFKKDRSSFDEEKQTFESERETFTRDREYWSKVDQYMKDNPGFAEVVQQEFAKIQGQEVSAPLSPREQAMQQEIESLKARFDAQDTATQERSQKQAEEKFVKSTVEYKKKHSDFDWDSKDEFGHTLQERIENHAIENEFKNFNDAANAYLFDQHMKRAAIKAKEDAAKELQKQRKLGLGPVTDHSTRTATQARTVSQMSYEDLMREGLTELGIDA